jgi:hypothetical protein
MTQFQAQLGNAFFAALGSEDMDPLQAINEIIANSIDSWIEEYCNKKTERPKLAININMTPKEITIEDNAGGMEPDELKNAMGFAKVQKENSPCADDLMGMYGFGLKAATANLGGHFEVISKRKNKELCHVVMPIQKMAEEAKAGKSGMLSDIEESGFNKKTKINAVEKLFNHSKTKSGTLIYISKIKRTNFNPESIRNQLSIAWYFFTNKNHLGPAIEIYFNGEKLGEPVWGETQGGKIPFSTVDFELPISWREETKTYETKVGISIWLNYKGGQFDAGGFSLYRKLQMVAYKDQKIGKWWSNESALIEGYLSSNFLKPNQRKDDLDRTTRFYKQLDAALNPIMKGASKLINSQSGGLDGKGFKRNLIMDDEFELMRFIALGWQKYFHENSLIEVNSIFPKELEKYMKSKSKNTGSDDAGSDDTGSDDTGSDDTGSDDTGSDDTGEKFELFEPIDENSFKFDQQIYQLLILRDKTDGSSYDWKKTGEHIEIFIDDDADDINDDMSDMLKKLTSDSQVGRWEKLSLNLIKEHVIHQFLLKENLQNARAFSYSKAWIENIYKK